MVRITNPKEYEFSHFEKSRTKYKKYDAVLFHKTTNRTKRVSFGDNRYEQYKDSTGLGLYSSSDHLDKDRRKRYRARHRKTAKYKYSSSWFSFHFLW